MTVNRLVRPFLKWAGGKRQLVPEILQYVPKKYGTYYEPFIGGGAVLFTLQPSKAVINDSNPELTNCYEVIRDSVEDLIDKLKQHKLANCEDYYYKIRSIDRLEAYKTYSKVEKAARILYLNKTCFNGLFRVNSQGQFNVPFGRYENPSILDEAVLRGVSKYLKQKKIEIVNKDFAEATKTARKGDFIYFDPPYDPVSSTASFTGYDINGFDKQEQERLKEVIDNLGNRGCKVLLSNSCTDFIVDLYREVELYKIEIVSATRAINSNALKRGQVDEVLIRNYDL